MLEPISKATLAHRAFVEVAAYLGASAFAMTMTTAEVAISFSVVTGVIGVVVWLVRLEGRINTHAELLQRVEQGQTKSGEAISDIQSTVAQIAGHMGVNNETDRRVRHR